MSQVLDVESVRRQFPALSRELNGRPIAFLDGPAGSQVPQSVVDAVCAYLHGMNANHGGAFVTSLESDALLVEARRAVADLVGSPDPDLVSFGLNMTTLTFALSRALAQTWSAGDEVVVCRGEHDANFTPWILAARDAGAVVRQVEICQPECTVDLDDLRSKLSSKTRLVAVGCASNAVGTVHPVAEITRLAHDVGALVFLDAVHQAPHAALDVEAWDCDFLACSAYKFFGPHVGVLYGKRQHMESLPAYKLRPPPETLPDRWMTGTQSHEGIAGTLAAVDYIADLGQDIAGLGASRREALMAAFELIGAYERGLVQRLLEGLATIDDVRVWGITDPRSAERAPTVSFTHFRCGTRAVAEHLAARGIFVWDGNFYAQPLTEALDLEPGGLVRVGFLHYNTTEEVDRLLAALREL